MFGYVFLVTVIAFSTASVQGGPCTEAPGMCFPTGPMPSAKTCITSANNDSGLSWYQMGNACKQKDGRLLWFRDDFDIHNILTRAPKVSLVVIGLLSSTTDNVDLFWRDINDNSSFTCDTSDTKSCLTTNSTEDTCTAVGCCWRNETCQYPSNQSLLVYNVNKTISNISSSTERQCVGFQLNANSSHTGRWISYDCFTPTHNAQYVCEYKCNATEWPATNTTNFKFTDSMPQTTTDSQPAGVIQDSTVTPNSLGPSNSGGTHENNSAPTTDSSAQHIGGQGNNSAPITTGSPSGNNGGKRENSSIPLMSACIMFLLISMIF